MVPLAHVIDSTRESPPNTAGGATAIDCTDGNGNTDSLALARPRVDSPTEIVWLVPSVNDDGDAPAAAVLDAEMSTISGCATGCVTNPTTA